MIASKAARYTGGLVAIVSLIYVVKSIYGNSAQIWEILSQPVFLFLILGGAVLYAALLLLVGAAWYLVMVSVGDFSLSLADAQRIFAHTQIFKYLPTNVIHMVGRFFLASKQGVSREVLSYAQAMEICLMISASSAVALILSLEFITDYVGVEGFSGSVSIGAYVTGLFLLIFCLPFAFMKYFKRTGGVAVSLYTLAAFCLHLLFFVGNGTILVVLVYSLAGSASDWDIIAGVASVGWLLGFIVPGAPGGLGVREAVLIAGLSTVGVPPPTATAIALAHRLVTAMGDALLFAIELGDRRFNRARKR